MNNRTVSCKTEIIMSWQCKRARITRISQVGVARKWWHNGLTGISYIYLSDKIPLTAFISSNKMNKFNLPLAFSNTDRCMTLAVYWTRSPNVYGSILLPRWGPLTLLTWSGVTVIARRAGEAGTLTLVRLVRPIDTYLWLGWSQRTEVTSPAEVLWRGGAVLTTRAVEARVTVAVW